MTPLFGSGEAQKQFLWVWIFVSKIHSLYRQQTPLCKSSKNAEKGVDDMKLNLRSEIEHKCPSLHPFVFQVEEGEWGEVGRTWDKEEGVLNLLWEKPRGYCFPPHCFNFSCRERFPLDGDLEIQTSKVPCEPLEEALSSFLLQKQPNFRVNIMELNVYLIIVTF